MSELLDLSIPPEEFHYSTDETYQSKFQQVFRFNLDSNDIADVYDYKQVKDGMDYILSKTSQVDEWWKSLFVKAAGMFLSEDAEMGLCVCLNYSFFDVFYKVFYCLEKNAKHESYETWKAELEKRIRE